MIARLGISLPALFIGAIAVGAGLNVPSTQAHIGALFILAALLIGACEAGIAIAKRL